MLPNYAFQWLVHLQKLNLGRNRLHTLNAKTFHSTSAIQASATILRIYIAPNMPENFPDQMAEFGQQSDQSDGDGRIPEFAKFGTIVAPSQSPQCASNSGVPKLGNA
jgi:hypothetical protein